MRPGLLSLVLATSSASPAGARPGLLGVALAASLVGSMSAVASVAPPTATAAERSLHIDWSAPAGCPRVEQVREQASKLLGRPLAGDDPATIRVDARVRGGVGGYVLTIETRSSSGTDRRRMQDARCAVLAEAAAVIAATAVDPSLAPAGGVFDRDPDAGLIPAPPGETDLSDPVVADPETADPPPAGDLSRGTARPAPGGDLSSRTATPAPPVSDLSDPVVADPGTATPAPAIAPAIAPEPAVDDEPAPRAATPPPAPRGPRFGLRLAGVFDIGSVPGPTGGLALTGALFGRLWRAELTALWLAPRTSRPDPAVDLGAQVMLFAAALRGCVVPRVRRLEIPVCGGFEAGAQRGKGVGGALTRTAVDTLPWLAVSAGPGLAFAVRPRLALTVQVDLVVPLVRTVFQADGFIGDVHRSDPAAGRALLGLEWRLR